MSRSVTQNTCASFCIGFGASRDARGGQAIRLGYNSCNDASQNASQNARGSWRWFHGPIIHHRVCAIVVARGKGLRSGRGYKLWGCFVGRTGCRALYTRVLLCACVCTCAHIKHVCGVRVNVCVCLCIHVYVCVRECLHVCMCKFKYMCVDACACRAFVCTCMYCYVQVSGGCAWAVISLF
jgi:hypothetical protein